MLDHVVVGQPHTQAHNDERDAINALQTLVDARNSPVNTETQAGKKQRALRRFHFALGGRNTRKCDVAFLAGDSLWTNLITSYADRIDQKFAKYMRQRFPQTAAGGIGYLSAYPAFGLAGTLADAPQSSASPYLYSPANANLSLGLDSAMTFLTAGMTETFRFTGTGCDIYLMKSAGVAAVSSVTINGTVYGVTAVTGIDNSLSAGAGTIAQAAGATVLTRYRVRGLSLAAYTAVITCSSGTAIIGGVWGYNGDELTGLKTACSTWPGKGTRNFVGSAYGGNATGQYPGGGVTGTPGYLSEQWLQFIKSGFYLPDAVFLDNYANDYGGTTTDLCSPAENLANHRSLIAQIKAAVVAGCTAAGVPSYVPSFIEIPSHCVVTSNIGGPSGNGGTMVANWQDYVANAYTLQATDPDEAVCVFDLGQRLQTQPSNTWDQSFYNGMLGADKVHLGPEGVDWYATALVDFVSPQ